jgi:hypothetical protein
MKNVSNIGNPSSKMRSLLVFTGLITVAMIFWSTLAYLLGKPSFSIILPLTIISIILFLGVGLLKNRAEKGKFEEFLEDLKRDRKLQEKIKDEKIDPGDKTGRAKVRAYYKERNSGLSWTGGSVHGTAPKRNKGRSFLPKNR